MKVKKAVSGGGPVTSYIHVYETLRWFVIHAKIRTVRRNCPSSVLSLWNKYTMARAGNMPFHRYVQQPPRSRRFRVAVVILAWWSCYVATLWPRHWRTCQVGHGIQHHRPRPNVFRLPIPRPPELCAEHTMLLRSTCYCTKCRPEGGAS